MKILISIIATLVLLTGCYDIDEIVITIDEQVAPGQLLGDATIKIDGKVYVTDVRFNIPILTTDISEVVIPYTPPPPRGHIAIPDDVDEVWILEFGTKFHWSCWRTDEGSGRWINLDNAMGGGYDACALCLDVSAIDRWKEQ